MQYGYYTNQKAWIDLGNKLEIKFDSKDPAIIDFIKEFAGTGELETIFVDGKCYYWLSYSKLIDELPLLDITENESMARRLNKLCKAGILVKHLKDKYKTYFAFGHNYIQLVKPHSQPPNVGGSTFDTGVEPLQTPHFQDGGGSTFQPDNHYTKIPSSSKVTETEKTFLGRTENQNSEIISWKPNPVYAQTVDRACPDLDELALQVELTKFLTHFKDNWPKNPDNSWLGWCQRANNTYREDKQKRDRIDQADKSARELMQNYTAKKQENIAKIGTQNNSKYPPKKEIFQPIPTNYASREEFYQACDNARNEGQIVEPYSITSTAERIWGEHPEDSPNFSQNLADKMAVPPPIDPEMMRRKLILQANGIKN